MEKGVVKWGVIPFRGVDNENLEFLVVSTKNGNWSLPKGNPMKKLGSRELLYRKRMKKLESSEQLWIKKFPLQ